MSMIKHLGNLLGEFFEFAMENKAWWIIPIILVLLVLGVLIATTGAVAPFIYTLF